MRTTLTLGDRRPIIRGRPDGKEVLSDGGTTITWTIPTDNTEDGGITFPAVLTGAR